MISELPLEELIQQCIQERRAYLDDHVKTAPATMELLRRAILGGNEVAWEFVYTMYRPLLLRWTSKQKLVESEDLIHDVLIKFQRYAQESPDLLDGEELIGALAYLKQCAMSVTVDAIRAHKRQVAFQVMGLEPECPMPTPEEWVEQQEKAEALERRLQKLLKDDEERLVLHLRFTLNIKPREIQARHTGLFDTAKDVYKIVQRLTKRLRKDALLRRLHNKKPPSPPEDELDDEG